eukprot:scaffold36975_cov221-Amphora_coffeaeformis.AAC.4
MSRSVDGPSKDFGNDIPHVFRHGTFVSSIVTRRVIFFRVRRTCTYTCTRERFRACQLRGPILLCPTGCRIIRVAFGTGKDIGKNIGQGSLLFAESATRGGDVGLFNVLFRFLFQIGGK